MSYCGDGIKTTVHKGTTREIIAQSYIIFLHVTLDQLQRSMTLNDIRRFDQFQKLFESRVENDVESLQQNWWTVTFAIGML